MEKQRQDIKKTGENSANMKKKSCYSKEGLLPESILQLIPYKETQLALDNKDTDELQKLLSQFVRYSLLNQYYRFDQIETMREKKQIMKAHVYLDALITLHRLPGQIQKPLDVLAEQLFKGLNVDAVRAILEKFTEVQEINRGEMDRGKGRHQLN